MKALSMRLHIWNFVALSTFSVFFITSHSDPKHGIHGKAQQYNIHKVPWSKEHLSTMHQLVRETPTQLPWLLLSPLRCAEL